MIKFIFLIVGSLLFANDLTIESKSFKYDSKRMVSEFIGDVNATKGDDYILAKKMVVYFNKNKKVKYIEAEGDVRFKIGVDKKNRYTGKAEDLKYFIKSGDIILKNGYIRKVETNDTIKGDLIKMNKFTKNIDVESGSKGAVKINLKVEK